MPRILEVSRTHRPLFSRIVNPVRDFFSAALRLRLPALALLTTGLAVLGCGRWEGRNAAQKVFCGIDPAYCPPAEVIDAPRLVVADAGLPEIRVPEVRIVPDAVTVADIILPKEDAGVPDVVQLPEIVPPPPPPPPVRDAGIEASIRTSVSMRSFDISSGELNLKLNGLELTPDNDIRLVFPRESGLRFMSVEEVSPDGDILFLVVTADAIPGAYTGSVVVDGEGKGSFRITIPE